MLLSTPDKRCQYGTANMRSFSEYRAKAGTLELTIHLIEKNVFLTKLKNLLDIDSCTDEIGYDNEGNPVVGNSRLIIEKIIHSYKK